ncbi:MAG: diguanylate cyclase, partial [Burkholderiaceae bacterium]
MSILTRVWHWLTRLSLFKTLRKKFILGFIIASLLAVGNVLVVQSLLRQSDTIAATINIAGKMRMLSQRIGLMQLATQGRLAESGHDAGFSFQKLEQSFESAMLVLRYGGQAFDMNIPAVAAELHHRLDEIEVAWVAYRRALATMRNASPRSGILENNSIFGSNVVIEMIAANEWLLNNTETLINSLVDDAQNMQEHVMHKIYGLFLINVLMLFLAWMIIFSKVLKPINRLMHLSNELAAGNYSTRLRMDADDEFGALSRVMNKTSAHIENLLNDLKVKQANLKQAKVKLQRAALVYQHISDGIVITDASGYAQDVNPAFSTITGYDAKEIIGNRLSKLSAGRHPPDFFRALWDKLKDTGQWRGDIWNRNKSGQEFLSHLMINSCFNDDGSVNCRIGLFSDVTEKRRQEALIWRQARFDHLTQLPNRQMFHENLQRSIEQSQRSGLPFALVFLDLDLFKEVNDTFGHDEGDVLLQHVAKRISQCCRRSDQVARLGGDEFIMIIQDLKDPLDVYPICDKLLKTVSSPYSLSVSEIRISCSVGVAFYPNHADNATELLKYADLAMYAAKEKGRNQYCLFSNSMRDSVQLRHDLLRDLQVALDSQQ